MKIFFGHYSTIQITVRKGVVTYFIQVISSYFSLYGIGCFYCINLNRFLCYFFGQWWPTWRTIPNVLLSNRYTGTGGPRLVHYQKNHTNRGLIWHLNRNFGLMDFQRCLFFAHFHEISMIVRFTLTCLLSYLSQILTSWQNFVKFLTSITTYLVL